MLGRDVCDIVPKGKKGGCCGGGAKAPVINGYFTINIKSNKQPIYELLIPGDRLPSKWSASRLTHDNRLFTNCRLYEDGEEVKILCVAISPFREEVVVFSPRQQRTTRFKEVDAASQLNIYVRGGVDVGRRAAVVDMGNGLAFNGVGNPNTRATTSDPRDRTRSLRELENEFWASMLIIEALLYSAESFEISAAGLTALRTVIDAVSRQEKIDALAKWAASLGEYSLNQEVEAEARMQAHIQMETQKMEVEMQKERLKVEAEQIELARRQQELAAQRAALQAHSSPNVIPQAYAQPLQQAPVYQVSPTMYPTQPYGYPPPPPPYYAQGPGGYGPPPGAYGPPGRGCGGGGFGHGGYGQYGGGGEHNHQQGKKGHSTGKAVAIGLGAGVLGALVTDMIVN